MNLNEYELKRRRLGYSSFSSLCTALSNFAYDKNEMTTEQLLATIKTIREGMPLPSGRWGNSLAVALEMQSYQGALLIIKNAADLGIDLNAISSEYGGTNPWNAEEVFELSQIGFTTQKISEDDELFKLYPWMAQQENDNKDAAVELSKILPEYFRGDTRK